MKHYFIVISKSSESTINSEGQQAFASWKCRDIAIAYGADSIILLHYEKGLLKFPEKDMNLDDYYPDLKQYVSENFGLSPHLNHYLLFVAAKKIEIARKCAIITALHSQPKMISDVREYFI
jgi:hypothetical protein